MNIIDMTTIQFLTLTKNFVSAIFVHLEVNTLKMFNVLMLLDIQNFFGLSNFDSALKDMYLERHRTLF